MPNPYVMVATAKVKLAEVKKLVAHIAGIVAAVLSLGLPLELPANVKLGIAVAFGLLSATGVYQAKNLPKEYQLAEPPLNDDGHGDVAMSAGAPGKHAA